MKNLLIGNGLNLTNLNENYFLTASEVTFRFKENLKIYWNMISKLVYKNNMNLQEILKKLNKQDGIEILAGKVFIYVYDEIKKDRNFAWNDCYRLIEILGEVSIRSIFFKDDKFLIPKIANEYIKKIESNYENIFTLNYIEEWDKNSVVKYLHGNLKRYIDSYSDIGSRVLSNNKDYKQFKKEKYKEIDFLDIVFMPNNEFVTKNNYIVEGLYTNKCGLSVYPADDLYPYSGRDIYAELNNLKSIEIFGMSPYGDRSVIEKIKKIKNKKIYVYKLNKKETNKWKSYGIENCFVEASKFIEK